MTASLQQKGDGVTIVDAGGGTLDISAYASKSNGKTFEEVAESQCELADTRPTTSRHPAHNISGHFKGSIFVTEAAQDHLEGTLQVSLAQALTSFFFVELLKGSKFRRDIPEMKRYFDRTTKCAFRDESDPHYVRFGSARDRDPKLKITAGKLRLEGSVSSSLVLYNDLLLHRKEVASFFEPSIKCIIDGVLSQRRIAYASISVSAFVPSSINFRYCTVSYLSGQTVFLVGGFAASDYLFKRVKEGLESHGLQVYRPDTQV